MNWPSSRDCAIIAGHAIQSTRQLALSSGPKRLIMFSDRLRILLVEDNPINQKVAEGMLEKHGHSVVIAENGKVALDILETQQFDLALMDLEMPIMDGIETTATIRAREHGTPRHLPILALTANPIHIDGHRCLEAGMDGYLTKPVQSQALLQAIFDTVTIVASQA